MDKIKIKDAALEQGMKAEDLVALLHEAGIKKTVNGSLSPEEYEKVKVKKSEASVEVVRKDVIIRRRSKAASGETPAVPAVEKKADAPVESAVEEKVAAPEAKTPERKSAPHAEKAPKKNKALREPTPSAKIVRPARVIAAPAPAVSPAAEETSSPRAATESKAAAPSQVPAQKAEGEIKAAAASAPAQKAEEKAVAAPLPTESARSEKSAPRAKKIETPARASAPQKNTEEAAAKSPEKADRKDAESPKAERSRRTPAASAEPEGNSQPSLLPPVQERRRNEEEKEEGRKKAEQPAPGNAPRVRVISRPDPAQARIVRPAAQAEGRPSRDGDNRRDGRVRDTRNAPRPDARDGRDGDFKDRDRDSRDNTRRGNGRPAGNRPAGNRSSSNAPFTPPFGQQPPVETEQSRKKRNNKNRRSNDFPQDSDMFSRRHGGMDMDDDEGMVRTRRSHKPKKQHQAASQSTQPMKAAKRKIRVEESIRVADMAHQMGVKSSEIIKILFGLGVMATINNALDIDTATLVASEFGYEVEKVGFSEEAYLLPASADTPEMLKPRPPVVTIMGHVDHGKTSLLDAIRKTSVTSGEAGGITQHIGAYHVKTKRGDIVFLDTPGHAAFTAMRARGAQVTDLVVLVVAADDGVMEQTREAINHSRAAGVPILVAVNKIDKETANPDRVLRELSELGLQPEEWGGDTVVGMVSAKTGKGLDDLLELIALQAEILELKANPDKAARGHVVEAKLDKGRGPVATVLVQEGTLHQGDVFVCGVFSGRVRALFNDQGKKIKEAGPSMPVEIQGFEGVPEAGDEFVCLDDEKMARRIAESRATKLREKELAKVSRVTLENFLKQSADTKEALVLNVVLKADVQGSLEAITESLRKLSTEKVRIDIIHGGAGAISESDVMLAAASNAIIIGFNVRPTAKVKEVAEQEQVDIRFYDIIYKLVDEIKSAMAGLLAPVSKEVYLGQAEVRQTFSLPKIGIIAGCMVTDGKLTRTANVRLLRDGVVVYTGKIASLKRLKDDAREVVRNLECGVGLDNFHDIKIGDIIEAFEMVEEAASLD